MVNRLPLIKSAFQKKHLSHPRLNEVLQWSHFHAKTMFLLVSALWIVLLYGRGICGPFIYDDLSHIQENPALSSWENTLHYFRAGDTFAHDLLPGGGSAYRPLLWLSLAVDRHLWGLNPCGFHITNLILHWMCGFLSFILLRRMQVPTMLSVATCLLWLGLPINSEAVAWISGRTYPLMYIFLMLSLLMAESYLKKGSIPTLFLYSAALLGALLSNEEGILALPLTMLLAYFSERTAQRRWLALALTGAVADGVYLVSRELVSAHMPGGPPLFSIIGTLFFKYVAWMLLPLHMSVERSTDVPANRFSVIAATAIVGLLCLLGMIYWLRKRLPLSAFGLIWMAIALLPFCGIVPIYQGMAERYVYLASFGFILAIVAAVWQSKAAARSTLVCIVILWGLWGAWHLRSRVSDWNNPIALYQASLETTPGSIKLLNNLGGAFETSRNLSKAMECYKKALELNPKYVPAIIGIGNIDQRTGDMDGAEQEYRRAITIEPSEEAAYCYLGALSFREGKIDSAIQNLSKAIVINPSDPTPYDDLGVVYQKMGDSERAIQMYNKVLALKPGDPEALTNLRTIESTR
jgi:tetratricopeptide (TPR) repeat protein